MLRAGLALSVTLFFTAFSLPAAASPDGISGYSGKSGSTCMSCHSGGSAPAVALTGPATLAAGASADFTLTVSGGQSAVAGLDVAASGGTLAAGTGTRLSGSEVTHPSPQRVSAAGVGTFSFKWTAPATAGSYTIFGAGLSGNGDGGTSGDGVGTARLMVSVAAATPPPPPPPTGCTAGATQACYAGAAATKGIGICKAGTQTCSGGTFGACVGQVLPGAELCGDGLDNNCDGKVDEGCTATVCAAGQTRACYSGPAGSAAIGSCRAGTQLCASNVWGACTGEVLPRSELCGDALDNNCDGKIDEGCPTICTSGQTRSCYSGPANTSGVGACVAGTQLCAAGAWQPCSGEVLPAAERCANGIDDDCNGQVDDGCTTPPPPPPATTCVSGATRLCYGGKAGTAGVGTCHAGLQTCSAGAWGVCAGEIRPEQELCNGVDDSCDGRIDEGCSARAGDDGEDDDQGEDSPPSVGQRVDDLTTGATPVNGQGCSTGGGAAAPLFVAALVALTLLRRRDAQR